MDIRNCGKCDATNNQPLAQLGRYPARPYLRSPAKRMDSSHTERDQVGSVLARGFLSNAGSVLAGALAALPS